MGWESRGKRRYYYRKRRQDGRVVSDYIGGGPLAECVAALDEDERQEREIARHHWQRTRDSDLSLDRELLRIIRLVRDLQAAVLLAGGYHTHRRQWRTSRHESA